MESGTSSPEPVHEERVLLLKDESKKITMVISDVHIGFEEELLKDGIYIPDQTMDLLSKAKRIISENKVERVIINGDLKHRVPTTQWKYRKKQLDQFDEKGERTEGSIQDRMEKLILEIKKAKPEDRKRLQLKFEELEREKGKFYRKSRKERFSILEKSEMELKHVAQFVRSLLDTCEVDVIPGNHDGRIQKELESNYPTLTSEQGLRFHGADGIIVGNAGIFHGHAWPSADVISQDYIIMGHGHAAVLLTDGLGVRNYEHCWLRARFTEKVHEKFLDANGEIILTPSFNDFFRGSPVNRRGRLLGPLFKNDFVDVDNGQIFLLDGINLGNVSTLKKMAQGSSWRR